MSVANSPESTTKHHRITQKSRNHLVFQRPGGRDFEAPCAAGQSPGHPAKVPQPHRLRVTIVSAVGSNRGCACVSYEADSIVLKISSYRPQTTAMIGAATPHSSVPNCSRTMPFITSKFSMIPCTPTNMAVVLNCTPRSPGFCGWVNGGSRSFDPAAPRLISRENVSGTPTRVISAPVKAAGNEFLTDQANHTLTRPTTAVITMQRLERDQ
jgi:hypothetical protein